jgi:ribokinase
MGRVWVVGSLNVDRPWRVRRHPSVGETIAGEQLASLPGGKGLNQAVAAARMGAEVVLVGCVGDDADGEWLVGVAAGEGIDVGGVDRTSGAPTGSALIVIDDEGANTVTVAAGANASLTVGALGLSPGDVVVAQLEVPVGAVAEAFRQARSVGATTVLNPSPVGESGDLLSLADVLVVNEHEAAALGLTRSACAGERQTASSAYGTEDGDGGGATVVVTLGADGCVAWGPQVDGSAAQAVEVAGVAAEVVDTTGAGDCFLGVLAAGVAGDLPFVDALERANRAAAASVGRLGTVPAMPTLADL